MYRSSPNGRPFLCAQCSNVEWGPLAGGPVACSRCRATATLPDRSAMLTVRGPAPMPSNDPNRLAQLRLQDGRPRLPTPTLVAVLGGESVMPGREQEALVIWNNLRGRAAQGDMAASEDLTLLTLMLAQHDAAQGQPDYVQALCESALDAVILPRHKQEQLGKLCRMAAARGDRARAMGYLSAMQPNATELDSDSEYRVSIALLAAIDRDGNRILEVLGPAKDVVPITDSMDEMASVIRAHGYELVGNLQAASQILRELPNPRALTAMQQRYPSIGLCQHSAAGFVAASNSEAANRAAASAGGIAVFVGGILGLVGVIMLGVSALTLGLGSGEGDDLLGSAITGGIGLVMLGIGVVAVVNGRAKAKKARWLRLNGLSLTARVVGANRTGTEVNDVPVMRFALQVAGPRGPYSATFDKLIPEHQVAMLVGREVRVRADPNRLEEVILEE